MKKSHKREIYMARAIFVGFLVLLVAILIIVVNIVSTAMRNNKAKTAESESNSQAVATADTESESIPTTESEPETTVEAETESQAVDTTEYRWTTTTVNFRTEANTDCDIIQALEAGTQVEFISEADGWAQVTYDGQTGYVSTDYLTDTDPNGDSEVAESGGNPDSELVVAEAEYSAASQVAVVIDPGHQLSADTTREANGPGSSTMKAKVTGGTTGVASGVPEYQLNLDISLLLEKELESRGYTVYLTRSTNDVNISNRERAEYAASVGGTIFIRIHANGSDDSSVNGALTLCPSSENEYVAYLAEDSMALSESILTAYCSATGLVSQGCQTSDTMTGINWSTIPVVILEMGYMTNEEEDLKMQDSTFRARMVQGIANGIDDYFGF